MSTVAPHRQPRGRLVLWGVGLSLTVAIATVIVVRAWNRDKVESPARPLVVVVSGDTAGWIVPCGCTSNQSGGLLRRGAFIDTARKSGDVVYLDAGGAPGGTSAYHRVKFEAILRGELEMGLAAHNLGGLEAALGADYLRQTGTSQGVPFVSANVRDGRGNLIADPIRFADGGGKRLAIVGVLSRKYKTSDVQIDDPREAILRTLAELKPHYDSLLVLAYLPEDELQQLAAALPEADMVIGGPTGQSIAPRKAGPTLLASATNKGKFIIKLNAVAAGARLSWTGDVAEMNEAVADDPRQQENLQRYLADLARRDFRADDTGLMLAQPSAMPPDYRFGGDASCAACHQRDCKLWQDSPHARAWDVVRRTGAHADPSCQQCHTTGYGLPGGFLTMALSQETTAVRCESCHGPALAHSRRPETRTPFAAKDQCVRCHDRENSPKFDYAQYWPRIQHGKPSATKKDLRPPFVVLP